MPPGARPVGKADARRAGMQSMGIYRLSGTTSKVQKLKAKFDAGESRVRPASRTPSDERADWSSVDLLNDEAINDINIIAGCLKLWFRELPEPLMTWELYQGFIDAASQSARCCAYLRSADTRVCRGGERSDAAHQVSRMTVAPTGPVLTILRRMHERVNDLPDANYATLKYLMGHLDKCAARISPALQPPLTTAPPGSARNTSRTR